MKRTLWALFSVLALTFAALAPSSAQAANDVTCTTPTVSNGGAGNTTYPQNYLWFCEKTTVPTVTISAGNKGIATTALEKLGNPGNPSTLITDAKTKMSSANHYVYVFPTEAEFHTYCAQTGNTTPTPVCIPATQISGNAGYSSHDPNINPDKWQSLIFVDRTTTAANTDLGNTTAHEAGHQLDYAYGIALYGFAYASSEFREFSTKVAGTALFISGNPVAGDEVQVVFQGLSLGAPVTVKYDITGNEGSLNNVTSNIAAAINAEAAIGKPLAVAKLHAAANGTTITVTSHEPLEYSHNVVPHGGPNVIVIGQSTYDFDAFIRQPTCGGALPFALKMSEFGIPICGDLQIITVGGTIQSGKTIHVTITDTLLAVNPLTVDYTTTSTTASVVATGLANAINSRIAMTNPTTDPGIVASASGSTVRMNDGSLAATYSTNTAGTTITLSVGSKQAGKSDFLENDWNGDDANVLQQAWSHDFLTTQFGSYLQWFELFADETAIIAGQVHSSSQTQDNFLQSGNFSCSRRFVEAIEHSGMIPSTTNYPYSTSCK